jgi:hypothetical protein
MIDGVHALVYTSHATELRTFLRDVLGFELADGSPEWPIFALPSAREASALKRP